jgi:hypothetical protein
VFMAGLLTFIDNVVTGLFSGVMCVWCVYVCSVTLHTHLHFIVCCVICVDC